MQSRLATEVEAAERRGRAGVTLYGRLTAAPCPGVYTAKRDHNLRRGRTARALLQCKRPPYSRLLRGRLAQSDELRDEPRQLHGSSQAQVPLDVITLTFVRGGGEVVFKNTYESLSVDGRCVPITERTSLT